MTELEKAEQIARQAHAGQKEESTGDDYIHHIERVVALCVDDRAKTVAWLHDVIEDTSITLRALKKRFRWSAGIMEAVSLLTRSTETYADYISIIKASENELAIAVKLADLRDHLRPDNECPARLRPRYEAALSELNNV